MNKIIIALCAVLFSFAAQAVIPYHDTAIIVTQKSGVKSEYLFSRNPLMTFNGDDLKLIMTDVNTNHEESVEFAIADVENITFVGKESGVQAVESQSAVKFAADSNNLYAENMTPGAELTITGIDGRVAARAHADAQGAVTVAIDNLTEGVYVVYAQGVSFKFIK